MAQHVNFITANNCDPRTAYFSTLPVPKVGVQQIIPSRVTMMNQKRPEVYMGWESPLPTPVVTEITPGPALVGVGAAANCGVGESVPALVKCDVGVNLAFGKIAVRTDVIDYTTIDRKQNPCGIAMAKFRNVIKSGVTGERLATLLSSLANTLGIPTNRLRPDMTEFEFMREFTIWRTVAWMQKRMSGMTQNGNPSNPATAAYSEHYGLRTLLNADPTLYPCISNAAIGAKAGPLNLRMEKAGDPMALATNEIEFYERLNDLLQCFKYQHDAMQFSVTPKLIVPNGTAMELIKTYIKGSLYLGAATATPNIVNGGAEVRDEVNGAVASGVINTLTYGPVEIMEDEMVSLQTTGVLDEGGSPVTIAPGTGAGKIQIVPIQSVNGENVVEEEYFGFRSSEANRDTFIFDAEVAEDGQQWGRFRVIEVREGSCVYWLIECQKRLLNNFPFLTGWIGDLIFKTPTCVRA